MRSISAIGRITLRYDMIALTKAGGVNVGDLEKNMSALMLLPKTCVMCDGRGVEPTKIFFVHGRFKTGHSWSPGGGESQGTETSEAK